MCTYPVQPVCTSLPSLLFILLFIKTHILFFSYLFCTFLYSIAHFTLYFSFFTYIYALVLCYFYIIYILLHCPLSGPGLIYISLLIKLRWALFVTYTIIQSIKRSEMCSLHLTHPSGAVGSWHCGWGFGALPKGLTSNLGLPRISSPTLYPLGHDCPVLCI